MKINEDVTIIQLGEDNFKEILNGLIEMEAEYDLTEGETIELVCLRLDIIELQEEVVVKLDLNLEHINMIRTACDTDSDLHKQFTSIDDRKFYEKKGILRIAN